MIYTVLSTAANDAMQWQSELLEYSWGRVKQPGELVRLLAAGPDAVLPRPRLARVVRTMNWSPHPYTGDAYPPYNTAASLLEWLFAERIDGTILLIEPDCVFRSAVTTEVGPGEAQATAWFGFPHQGEGPFGLGPSFAFLERFCVDRALVPARVTLPVLIHASDLRKVAARWLELMSIIRVELAKIAPGDCDGAAAVAYAIAAAEAAVPHAIADLGADTSASACTAPLLHYRHPIESAHGEIVWDERTYQCWEAVDPQRAAPGTGRDFLALLDEYVAGRVEGGELALLRPRRHPGVRVGRVLDQTLLEIPGRADTLSLNPSAAAIWDLCDGSHSLADLSRELATRFHLTPAELRPEVQSVVERLESVGALDLQSA